MDRRMQEVDTPEECRSVKELYALAKKKGYKPGWAYHKARERGML